MLNSVSKLVGIDLETTGSSFSDRIVEIALVSYEHGVLKETFCERINPGIPIPKNSTLIHGITDEDVAGKPRFEDIADAVLSRILNSVLFGYNVIFDFNVLSGEMVRAGKSYLDPKKWTLVDPFVIWKKHDPKTLTHAYETFCGKKLENSHSALADINATYEVLAAQVKLYEDLPKTSGELGQYCYPGDPSWVCSSYHFIWNDKGEILCNFGKNKGVSLTQLLKTQKHFCQWVVEKEFPEDVKHMVQNALEGKPLPVRPAAG